MRNKNKKCINSRKRKKRKKRKEGRRRKTHFQFRLCAYVLFELSFFFSMAKVDWRGELKAWVGKFSISNYIFILLYLFNVKMLCVGANIMKKVSFLFCLLHVIENLFFYYKRGVLKNKMTANGKLGRRGLEELEIKKETICYIWGYAV